MARFWPGSRHSLPLSTSFTRPAQQAFRSPGHSGDRVKTDRNDALHLARLLKLDQITEVVVPEPAQEAARDLVRAREDIRGDLMRARHRVSKLLLRQGVRY